MSFKKKVEISEELIDRQIQDLEKLLREYHEEQILQEIINLNKESKEEEHDS